MPLTNRRSEVASSESVSDHTFSEVSSMILSTTENISDVDVSTDDSGKQYEKHSDYRLPQNRGSLRLNFLIYRE